MKSNKKNNDITLDEFIAKEADRYKHLYGAFLDWYKKKNSGPRNRYFYPIKQEELGFEISGDASLESVWDDAFDEFLGTREYDRANKSFYKLWQSKRNSPT
jgi:hypothetical protein